jgi:hypothetical protein
MGTYNGSWRVDIRDQVSSIWTVSIGPTTLGRPIIKVDNIPWSTIGRLDDVSANDIILIDGVFLPDGLWHADIRSTSVGPAWEVTITA